MSETRHQLPRTYNSAHPFCRKCERPWPCPGAMEQLQAALDAALAREARLREAARDIVDGRFIDVDPEGIGGEWCHWCDRQTKDTKGRVDHASGCEYVALRAALAESTL